MQAEFVIVGAGSAGCAMAYRLAMAGRRVVVIEHGGTDAGPFIQMPAALSYPMNMARYDWGYRSEREPHLNNRELACPRGKVIGGSSSINGMVYVRGHAMDFDHWEESGARGWGYAVFGEVVEGKDIVDAISQVQTGAGGPFSRDAPAEQIIINSVEILYPEEPEAAQAQAGEDSNAEGESSTQEAKTE